MRKVSSSLRLGRVKGIDVFVHWSWFVVAIYAISVRRGDYSFVGWNVLEYLALFAIVTAHEFGHALACRGTGGRADRIVLWPLGGIAYVSPPPRPGAQLWSIAAGPLVNLALIPVAAVLVWLSTSSGFAASSPDAHLFLRSLVMINVGLFVFNMLPIYPLDGGQILRSLLWYVVGRARSLMVTSLIGFVGVSMVLLAFVAKSSWLGLIALFAGMQCASGFRTAQFLRRLSSVRRRTQYQCPACKTAPPPGAYWHCASCRQAFDPFMSRQARVTGTSLGLGLSREAYTESESLTQAAPCAHCGVRPTETDCIDCGMYHPFDRWRVEEAATADQAGPAYASPALTPRAVTAPSPALIVLGVGSLFLAAISMIVAAIFIVILWEDAAQKPAVQAEIETFWKSEGIKMPGKGDVFLRRVGLYQVYLETAGADTFKGNALDISVMAFSVRPMQLNRVQFEGIHRGTRELLPKGSFFVSVPGMYTLHASTPYPGSDDARMKIGPADLTGSLQWVDWVILIVAIVCMLAFLAAAILPFRRYWKQRHAYRSA